MNQQINSQHIKIVSEAECFYSKKERNERLHVHLHDAERDPHRVLER